MPSINFKKLVYRDAYTLVAWGLFLVTVLIEWRGYVRKHEAIYLLGSRRVFDPEFLANDLSWSALSTTTFLYNQLLAPLWGFLGDYEIVNVGRVVAWVLMAWSLAMLARTLRLPPWSMLLGFTVWLLWGQTIAYCGSHLEGLQPKLLAHALAFFALAFALRGQFFRAGIISGLAAAFHIIIGGWTFLALLIAMLVRRKTYSLRQVRSFVLAAGLFIVPLVLAVGAYHIGAANADQRMLMDQIYVVFAAPYCLDPAFFMTPVVKLRAIAIFSVALTLIYLWKRGDSNRLLFTFVLVLIGIYIAGIVAYTFDAYWFLKLYPFRLANSIPALLLFVISIAMVGKHFPVHWQGRIVWLFGVVVMIWLVNDKDVFSKKIAKLPARLSYSLQIEDRPLYGRSISSRRKALYDWIRRYTSPDSVFITPYMPEFWTYAGREQVVAFRYPPHDYRIIEWKERLERLNGSRPFAGRGFQIRKELSSNEGRLPATELAGMRDDYGATYYITMDRRVELAPYLRFKYRGFFVYELEDI